MAFERIDVRTFPSTEEDLYPKDRDHVLLILRMDEDTPMFTLYQRARRGEGPQPWDVVDPFTLRKHCSWSGSGCEYEEVSIKEDSPHWMNLMALMRLMGVRSEGGSFPMFSTTVDSWKQMIAVMEEGHGKQTEP